MAGSDIGTPSKNTEDQSRSSTPAKRSTRRPAKAAGHALLTPDTSIDEDDSTTKSDSSTGRRLSSKELSSSPSVDAARRSSIRQLQKRLSNASVRSEDISPSSKPTEEDPFELPPATAEIHATPSIASELGPSQRKRPPKSPLSRKRNKTTQSSSGHESLALEGLGGQRSVSAPAISITRPRRKSAQTLRPDSEPATTNSDQTTAVQEQSDVDADVGENRTESNTTTDCSEPESDSPEFFPWSTKPPRGQENITLNLLDIINGGPYKPTKKEKIIEGYVYVYTLPSAPGYVKVGKTQQNPKSRIDQQKSKCKLDYQQFSDKHERVFPHYGVVERLVQAELWKCRMKFSCKRCKRRKERKECTKCSEEDTCEDCKNVHEDLPTEHSEWYKTTPEKALEVINRWRGWIIQYDPYTPERELVAYWTQAHYHARRRSNPLVWSQWLDPERHDWYRYYLFKPYGGALGTFFMAPRPSRSQSLRDRGVIYCILVGFITICQLYEWKGWFALASLMLFITYV